MLVNVMRVGKRSDSCKKKSIKHRWSARGDRLISRLSQLLLIGHCACCKIFIFNSIVIVNSNIPSQTSSSPRPPFFSLFAMNAYKYAHLSTILPHLATFVQKSAWTSRKWDLGDWGDTLWWRPIEHLFGIGWATILIRSAPVSLLKMAAPWFSWPTHQCASKAMAGRWRRNTGSINERRERKKKKNIERQNTVIKSKWHQMLLAEWNDPSLFMHSFTFRFEPCRLFLKFYLFIYSSCILVVLDKKPFELNGPFHYVLLGPLSTF